MQEALDKAAVALLDDLYGRGIVDVQHIRISVHEWSKPDTHAQHDLQVSKPQTQ